MTDHLIPPHGGDLVDLMASEERLAEIQEQSRDWLSWDLTPRQICDLELLMTGGFSPLRGFMNRADFDSVALGVLYEGGRAIETHRLCAKQPHQEGRRVVPFQVGRRVGDQRGTAHDDQREHGSSQT